MPIIQTVIQGGGTTPTGTKSITANGVYDVTDFASADVNVPTTAPAHYIEKEVSANGKLRNSTNIINLNGVTDIGDYALNGAYYGISFPSDTEIDLSSLTTVSGINTCQNMFTNASGITSVDLSGLITVSGSDACASMFNNSRGITSINLSNLTTISSSNGCQYMLRNCSSLTSINLSSLTTISGNNGCNNMFYGCSSLTSVSLSSLTTITSFSACMSMFSSCTSLTSLSFPALTSSSFGSNKNQFQNLVSGVKGCTIHFPSNLDPTGGSTVISSLTGYPNFGGTNTVLTFDLPATE